MWRNLNRAFHLLPPEAAHRAAILGLKSGFGPRFAADRHAGLAATVFGKATGNPVGLAAGFDKHGEAISGCLNLGFGFTEIGSVTPQPQDGNAKPRVFRLSADRAVINRYGFNSEGLVAVAKRLEADRPAGLLGINLGKNKTSKDAVADYVSGATHLRAFADYLVVNVSSPNTPGLRGEQSPERLLPLLEAVKKAAGPVPLVLKVAPDLTEDDVDGIADCVLQTGTDGLIVSNTTLARPDSLQSRAKAEAGGLSGAPLFDPSTGMLRLFADRLYGKVTLIGAGGISTGEHVAAKLRAGASLVQLYSAMIYEGPGLPARLQDELATILKRDGLTDVGELTGADLR